MASDIEFFDELRELIGEEAARAIVRRTAATDSLANDVGVLKDDVRELKGDVRELKDDVHGLEVRVLTAIRGSDEQHRQAESQMFRWMLTFNTSQWLALVGMIVAIVLKG